MFLGVNGSWVIQHFIMMISLHLVILHNLLYHPNSHKHVLHSVSVSVKSIFDSYYLECVDVISWGVKHTDRHEMTQTVQTSCVVVVVVLLLAGLIEPLGRDMPEQECAGILLFYSVAPLGLSGSVWNWFKVRSHSGRSIGICDVI